MSESTEFMNNNVGSPLQYYILEQILSWSKSDYYLRQQILLYYVIALRLNLWKRGFLYSHPFYRPVCACNPLFTEHLQTIARLHHHWVSDHHHPVSHHHHHCYRHHHLNHHDYHHSISAPTSSARLSTSCGLVRPAPSTVSSVRVSCLRIIPSVSCLRIQLVSCLRMKVSYYGRVKIKCPIPHL